MNLNYKTYSGGWNTEHVDLRGSIIETIKIIVKIETENAQGEKPVLNELKWLLVKTYGEILMSIYLVDCSVYFPLRQNYK